MQIICICFIKSLILSPLESGQNPKNRTICATLVLKFLISIERLQIIQIGKTPSELRNSEAKEYSFIKREKKRDPKDSCFAMIEEINQVRNK